MLRFGSAAVAANAWHPQSRKARDVWPSKPIPLRLSTGGLTDCSPVPMAVAEDRPTGLGRGDRPTPAAAEQVKRDPDGYAVWSSTGCELGAARNSPTADKDFVLISWMDAAPAAIVRTSAKNLKEFIGTRNNR